jgi:FAD/FMN-containing dehydrogenase
LISSSTQRLSGWGRYPAEDCAVFRPEKRRTVAEILESEQQPHYIARGLGRSYGDTAVNGGGGVLSTVRLNRMLAFDDDTGILECEAGVSLAEIVSVFLPRGWFLPVTPGTKFVTVGGAIANDVHGKNHHRDGTFCAHVPKLTLLTPKGKEITCSPVKDKDVFWATVGGIGLTGIILTATIQLQRVKSAHMKVDYRRLPNIHKTLATIRETDEHYQYSVAWVDCLAKGNSLGRSVLMLGNHAEPGELGSGKAPFAAKPSKKPGVPFDFPGIALNPLTIKAFNAAFYATHPTSDSKIIDYDTYFYPLDAVNNWNRIYGKRGFTQYQATFPTDQVEGLVKLLERLSAASCASFLAVLKRFGPQGEGLLSYPFEGYTLTLDIPIREGLLAFLQDCDRLVLEYGGRLYLAKDMCMRADTFAAMYPRVAEFRKVRRKLDPNGVLSSRMARRLRLAKDDGV